MQITNGIVQGILRVLNKIIAKNIEAETVTATTFTGSLTGTAQTATKLDTATAGSATQPVYFNGGKPVATTYSLEKSVPSDALFTDTKYSAATTSANGLMSSTDKTKLDGIATGANKTTVENVLTSTSTTNALSAAQGKALNDTGYYSRTSVGATTDWNNLTQSGTYKVQMAAWGNADTYHSPNKYKSDLYSFGMLFVIGSITNDTESRTVQIYFPHQTGSTNIIVTRMKNSTNWNNWSPIYQNTTYGLATTSANGLMAKEDKKYVIPFVVGTQTAVTGAFTGSAPTISALYDGLTINYWLPYNGSGNATLNLTLSNGTTTGAKDVYYNGTGRLTTHYPGGSIFTMTYRENVSLSGSTTKYTGWWCKANYDSNTYDRLRYQQNIKAGDAIVAGNLIVGKDGVYNHLKSGKAFDITYPILYAASNIAASATSNNNYIVLPFTITTTQSITFTAYKPVYIKGTLNGTIFTPVNTAPLTQTVPTTDDGYQYILLGTAYSTTALYLLEDHRIFSYKNGKFNDWGYIANRTVTSATEPANLAVDDEWLQEY